MQKWFVVLVGVVGAFFLINAYIPQAWGSGFHVLSMHVPWAVVILGGFIVIAARLKSK